MSFRQPNQQFTSFPWPINFQSNTPVNQWPVPPNFSYYLGHPSTHPQLPYPLQNPYNFPAQPHTTASLVPHNIPNEERASAHTLPAPPEKDPSDVNSPNSDIITNLKEWVIVDLEEDGTFRIAGHHLESGRLHSSEKIVFVNNQGNLTSDGQQTFLLHGPIAWRLYEVQFPGLKVSPNSQLKQAFSNGFPKSDRKRWISKLFDFLEQMSSKASPQNAVNGHRMSPPTSASLSLIQRNTSDTYKRRWSNDLSCVDENETIPSITMLEEGNQQQQDDESSSNESEEFRTKSRRCRVRQRLYPKFVDIGVQTLPQKPPERPKMVSRSTSTRNERQPSPITDWMRSGCRLDRILREAYPEESTQYDSTESPLANDEMGPSSSSRFTNRPSTREASSNSKSSHHQAPRKSLRLVHPSNTEESSKKKSSAATRSSHIKSKPMTVLSNSSSSISNISSAYLKGTFPQYQQFEIIKEMKAISKLDDKHTLITQNG
ncbi:unnamed protein product [Hymenolepis diminuta]|nr:unnamed protein product [Hymenolepis diminuta]